MKVVILAGGLGTRLSEETDVKPKPMVEIGDRPVLHHIMERYGFYGYDDFIICLGYKGFVIKEYFGDLRLHKSNVSFDFSNNSIEHGNNDLPPWKVTLVDTGINSETGERLRRVRPLLENQPFMLTYGDGVGNIDIDALIKNHKASGKLVTVTAVRPPARFGAMEIAESGAVVQFEEKPPGDNAWINGGFFVIEPEALVHLDESGPLESGFIRKIMKIGQLNAYKHQGFWRPMDTLREKRELNMLWERGNAPWAEGYN